MYCNNCGIANPKNSKFCKHCGAKLHASITIRGKGLKNYLDSEIPPYPYVISIKKLITLFVFTGGIYQLYWFYKHFKSFKWETDWRVNPVARAIFSDFVAYSLFRRVSNSIKKVDKKEEIKAGWLAIIFAFFIGSGFLPFPYSFVAILSLIPLIPVQKAINYYWEKKYPDRIVRSKFGAGNIAWTIFGIIATTVGVLVMLYTNYGIDKNGKDKFFTTFISKDKTTSSITQEELTGDKLLKAVNVRRKENNLSELRPNIWVCEVAKIRLDDIHNQGVGTFTNTAALQRAMDKVTKKLESNQLLQKDIEPEFFIEVYTYQATVKDAIETWASYPENDFLTSKKHEYGCAAVGSGYGVLITGYGDMAKARKEYQRKSTDDNSNAIFL